MPKIPKKRTEIREVVMEEVEVEIMIVIIEILVEEEDL